MTRRSPEPLRRCNHGEGGSGGRVQGRALGMSDRREATKEPNALHGGIIGCCLIWMLSSDAGWRSIRLISVAHYAASGVQAMGSAAGQLVVTFNDREVEAILRPIEKLAENVTSNNKSAAAKLLMKAALGDAVAQATLREAFATMRELKDFTGAALPVAPELHAQA
jgi:hypothetical protein